MKKPSLIIVYGTDWCADCHRSKTLLDQHNISYDYRDIDSSSADKEAMLALVDGRNVIPTIVWDNVILQEPTDDALLAALDLKEETPMDIAKTPMHDVIMIGAGPAALSAAIYTTREDIGTLLLERGVVGGLAAVTDKIDNYPGFPDGIEGLTLADNLRSQAERFGAVIDLGEVTKIIDEGECKRLETTEGDMLARAVLIATGSDYKKIGVPGEKEYYARGVHYCATCDGAFYRGKRLAVVGGGNSAVQESLFLTRFTSHIDLLVRSTLKASEVLQHELEQAVKDGKITVHLQIATDEIAGEDNHVTKVLCTNRETNEKIVIETDGVFVFVGLKPNSEFLKDSSIELDPIGFVKTDKHLQTSMKGVFAAGDIRSGATMQIATAVGEGATAALVIREYLGGKLTPLSEAGEEVVVQPASLDAKNA
jgi:thioredoxin reductase (NADPH)